MTTKHFAFQQPVMLFTSCQPDDTASTWHFLCQYSLTMLDLPTVSSRCKVQVLEMKTLQHQDGRKSAFNIHVYAKEQRQASPPLTHLRKPATPPTTRAGNLHAILRALPSATSPNLEFCSVPKPRVPIMDSSPLAVFAKPPPKTPGLQAIELQDPGEAGVYFGSHARQKLFMSAACAKTARRRRRGRWRNFPRLKIWNMFRWTCASTDGEARKFCGLPQGSVCDGASAAWLL
ncbi:hypothetical protein IWZ01DRAFT_278786 [Phyllosticta capitalensis]